MKQKPNNKLAKEMADLCMERVEALKDSGPLMPETTLDARQASIQNAAEKLKHLMHQKLAWILEPKFYAHRIALGMFITVGLALLNGNQDPDGQWKTGGGH